MLATAASAMHVLAIDCIVCLGYEERVGFGGHLWVNFAILLKKANFGGVNL
jgi:hypothetical protein